MTHHYKEVHPNFKLNDYHFNQEGLKEVAYSFIKEGDFYEKAMGDFLLDWLDDNTHIYVDTSGSTGTPKTVKLDKQAMVNSAIATGKHFNLNAGDRALHCLPASYVAGKMMMVRAIVLGLKIDIVTPSSYPFDDTTKSYDFVALVPMQLQNSIVNLNRVKTVIVGGASVSIELLNAIQKVPCKVYETYGMTETITHIATRPLNFLDNKEIGPFNTMEGVSIETDDRNCLVITAHHLNVDHIHTNDVVNILSDSSFELIGRYDTVINTGGIKVFPEQIEKKLGNIIHERFFITDQKDGTLGHRVVLIIESNTNAIDNVDFSGLDKYEIPKAIFSVLKFVETHTGKINRKKTLDLVREKYNLKKPDSK